MHNQIYALLSNKDDITWQSLLYDLVRSENMDPWDIDISLLTKKYVETVKKLKELDYSISGKMVLAAAILLRIKSKRLLEEDMERFDQILSGEDEESLYDQEQVLQGERIKRPEGFKLIPKTPQPRRRKVSIYELMDALQQALEVNKRRINRLSRPVPEMQVPEKKVDISELMRGTYTKIMGFFTTTNTPTVTFSQLVPEGASKNDKIYTLIPLLYLANLRKIDLEQDIPFSDIGIMLNTDKEIQKELEGELGEP